MSKKKQQKNGFFYYMLDLQSDFREKGKHVAMSEMPVFAGPSWSKLSEAEKHRYTLRAKQEKARASGATGGPIAGASFTSRTVADSWKFGRKDSQGKLLSEKVDVEAEERRKKERILEAIRQLIGSCDHVTLENFWMIDIQSLCHIPNKPSQQYLPCEVGVVRYSLNQGVLSKFHSFIRPGSIPIGYRYLAQSTSESTHQIPVEGAPGAEGDYRKLLGSLESYLTCGGTSHTVPPVFTKRESLHRVEWCLQWLADSAGVTNRISQVYELESLLVELATHSGSAKATLSKYMVDGALSLSNFAHDSCSRCDYHQELDCSHCSLGISHAYCYAMSEMLCPMYEVSLTKNHLAVLSSVTAQASYPAQAMHPPPHPLVTGARPVSSARGTQLDRRSSGGRGTGRGIASLELRQPQHPATLGHGRGQPAAVGHGRGAGGLYM